MTRCDQKRVAKSNFRRVRVTLFVAALLCGAFTLSPGAAEDQDGARSSDASHSQFFPTPTRGLTIRAGGITTREGGQSLGGLLDEFAEVTGEQLLYGPETARMLDAIEIPLLSALEVAPEDVYSVVQGILLQHRFALGDVRRQEPRMLSVVNLSQRFKEIVWSPTRFVPVEQLDDYVQDSALLITTIVDIPDVDMRERSESIRELVTDPGGLQVIPLEESGQVILSGYGPLVHSNAQLLQRMNEAAAQARERRESK